MHKYKNLCVNDKIKIVKSSDPFTKTITNKIIGEIGIITNIEHTIGAPRSYFVYLKAIKAVLYLQRDALTYYGRSIPFNPLHRVLPNGEVMRAMIKGLHTVDNKSIVHVWNETAANSQHHSNPMCGVSTGLGFYNAILELAPKITCQKCLAIIHHRRRKLLESLQVKE